MRQTWLPRLLFGTPSGGAIVYESLIGCEMASVLLALPRLHGDLRRELARAGATGHRGVGWRVVVRVKL
jgi:hypothetical protein